MEEPGIYLSNFEFIADLLASDLLEAEDKSRSIFVLFYDLGYIVNRVMKLRNLLRQHRYHELLGLHRSLFRLT